MLATSNDDETDLQNESATGTSNKPVPRGCRNPRGECRAH
jgi:hypothetical protein